jgi:hypothetical protein
VSTIGSPGLLQKLGQRQSLLGHRILHRSGLKSRNSTLADGSDDHPVHTAPPGAGDRISTTSGDANDRQALRLIATQAFKNGAGRQASRGRRPRK